MAVTLNATAVPAPVAPGTPNSVGNAGANPLVSDNFSGGVVSGTSTKLNKNAKRVDAGVAMGAGGYAIGFGCVLSAGTGLTCAISDGFATIGGVVEVRSATPVVVTGSATNWIWLKQDGTFVVQTTTAKPSGECVCLGAAVTNGSGVTAIETAGVIQGNYIAT